MKFKDNTLAKAITQSTGFLVALANGEAEGAKWTAAIQKAIDETVLNDSITFADDVLTFVSRTSGKQRKVTRAGCHYSCDCQGKISYHFALYEIVSRYAALIQKPKPIFNLPTIEDMNNAPFMRESKKYDGEKVAGIRI
jgi:hypothetical protein